MLIFRYNIPAIIAAVLTFACMRLDEVGLAIPLVIGAVFVGLGSSSSKASQQIKDGFAGALGNWGSLIGVLSLVLYVVFSGTPDTDRTAMTSAVFLALGGLIQLVIGGAVALALDHRQALTEQAGEKSR